jgi:cytidine deaminase
VILVKQYIKNCKAKKTNVVAELVTTDGEVFYGVNIESSCHTLSICAERAAIVNAVIDLGPSMKIHSVKVYAEKLGVPIDIVPCGGCRQLVAEFSNVDTTLCDKPIGFWLPNPYL